MDRSVSGTGGTVLDYSGEGNDGTTSGGVTTGATGTFSTDAFDFDGSDDYVEVGNILNMGTNNFSGGAWFKTTSTAYIDTILGTKEFNGGNSEGYSLYLYHGQLYLSLSDGTIIQMAGNTYNDGNWHHAFFTVDRSGTGYLYANGSQVDSLDTSTLGDITSSHNFYIGVRGDGSGNKFNGTMDEVQIYNRALSQNEIKRQYQAGWNNLVVKNNGTPIPITNVYCTDTNFSAGDTLTIDQHFQSGDQISIVYQPAYQTIRTYTIP